MKIYTGKEDQKISTQELVETMSESLENNGNILYMDNFYTSISLFQSLREKKIRCTGTIRKNRIKSKNILADFAKSKDGDYKFYTNYPQSDLTLLLWKDKREVFFLSNHRDTSLDEIEFEENGMNSKKFIPSIRNHYNEKCRGVDKTNQLCKTFRYDHVQKKWWKSLFEQVIQINL